MTTTLEKPCVERKAFEVDENAHVPQDFEREVRQGDILLRSRKELVKDVWRNTDKSLGVSAVYFMRGIPTVSDYAVRMGADGSLWLSGTFIGPSEGRLREEYTKELNEAGITA